MKLVEAFEAAAGENDFTADDVVARLEKSPQVGLLLGVRSPVGVAAFGGAWEMVLSIPENHAFAESCSGSDDHFVGALIFDAFVDADQLIGERTSRP